MLDQLKSGPNPASRSRLLFHAKLLLVQIAQSHNTITVVTVVEAMSHFQARFVAPKDCKTAKLYPRSADDRREAPVGAPLQNGLDVPCDATFGHRRCPILQPPFLGTTAVTLFTAVDKDALKDALQDDW